MAIIFKTSSLRKEFEELCQKIIPKLNDCNNCGILKCVFCSKFTVSCSICRKDRCKNCVLFQNTVDLLFEKCSKEQWDYVCNFLYDLFRVSWLTAYCFKDLKPINSSVKNIGFVISNDPREELKKNQVKNSRTESYYLTGSRKYKFYKNF